MADKISANITYLDSSGKKGTKAITDISTSASNGAIKNFCNGLIGLTTNLVSQIDKVEKTDITSSTVKPKFPTSTIDPIELENWTIAYVANNEVSVRLTDGFDVPPISVQTVGTFTSDAGYFIAAVYDDNGDANAVMKFKGVPANFTATITFAETDEYAETSFVLKYDSSVGDSPTWTRI